MDLVGLTGTTRAHQHGTGIAGEVGDALKNRRPAREPLGKRQRSPRILSELSSQLLLHQRLGHEYPND
jgi:hypothetical protein